MTSCRSAWCSRTSAGGRSCGLSPPAASSPASAITWFSRGSAFASQTARPDTTSPALDLRRLAGAPLDIPTTERLVWETYRYAGLLEGDVTRLESTSASIASTLSFPFVQLAYAYSDRGEEEKMQRALDYALQALPQPRPARGADGA